MVRKKSQPIRRRLNYARDDIRKAKRVSAAKKAKIRLIALVVLGFVLIIAFLWVMRLPSIQIKSLAVAGNESVATDQIKQTIKPFISGSYFFIIPRSNIFFYPKDKITESLLKKYGYFSAVSLKVKNKSVLGVEVSERRASYVWCQTAKNNCWLVDWTGLLFSRAKEESVAKFFLIEGGDQEGKLFALFGRPLAENQFKKLDSLVSEIPLLLKEVSDDGFTTKLARLDSYGDIDFNIENKSGGVGNKWQIKVNLDQDRVELLSNIRTVLKNPDFIAETARDNIAYIDFRFGKKVFYKFKSQGSLNTLEAVVEDEVLEEETEEETSQPDESQSQNEIEDGDNQDGL